MWAFYLEFLTYLQINFRYECIIGKGNLLHKSTESLYNKIKKIANTLKFIRSILS